MVRKPIDSRTVIKQIFLYIFSVIEYQIYQEILVRILLNILVYYTFQLSWNYGSDELIQCDFLFIFSSVLIG